jgi:Flp pilus assembly protein TadB
VARVLGAPARTRRARRAADELVRELAVAVDLIGVGVAAGCTPFLAVETGARWSPRRVARALDDVIRACALGQSFDDALRELGLRMPGARPLTDALRTSAQLGAPAGPALTRLGADLRADLRRRAEARARTVPVRLCLPLVGCILPAFALLTVVPVVLDGFRA